MSDPSRPRLAGIEAICAIGNNLADLNRALRDGTSGLCQDTSGRWTGAIPEPFGDMLDADRHAAGAPNPSSLPPGLLSLVAAVVLGAFRNAGIDSTLLMAPDTALVVSTTKGDIRGFLSPPGETSLGPFARRVHRPLAMTGHCELVSCACASGGVALARATRLMADGWARRVVVLGVDILDPFVVEGFACLGAASPGPCRPFDDDRDGLCVGEAAAAILLVDDDLPGVRLTGSGQSCDAFTLVRPTEDGTGLAAAIRQALEEAGPGAVDAICGHGTGTIANDGMELAAFRTAFHDAPPPVFGIKGATGHTLGAAGVLEAAACALSLIHGYLPGTVGFTGTASGVDVTTRTRGAAPRRILTVNSGFGGVNVALVLERTR